MMTASAPMTVDLAGWPGVVLHVSEDARVVATNGRLDLLLGTDVVGRRVTELLDRDSSLRKWERIAEGAVLAEGTWELIFCAADRVLETGAYSVVRVGDGQGWWLVEHQRRRCSRHSRPKSPWSIPISRWRNERW